MQGNDEWDDDEFEDLLDDLDDLGVDFDDIPVFDDEELSAGGEELFGDANTVKDFYAYGMENSEDAGFALALAAAGEVEEVSPLCQVCGEDTEALAEYYMVKFELWKASVPFEMQGGMLCVGCLEGLLGRELVREDFLEAPVNYSANKSERLLARLGEWFRAADGPFESPDEMKKTMDRLSWERGW